MAFTDSADAVFSVEASAADGRDTATGFVGTVFFVSSRAAGAADSVDAIAAGDAITAGGAGGFGSAISSARGMVVVGALMLAPSVC